MLLGFLLGIGCGIAGGIIGYSLAVSKIRKYRATLVNSPQLRLTDIIDDLLKRL